MEGRWKERYQGESSITQKSAYIAEVHFQKLMWNLNSIYIKCTINDVWWVDDSGVRDIVPKVEHKPCTNEVRGSIPSTL